jgi:predicted phosphodiesterase
MMRIAVFSDVHANLPAFEAFCNDVDARRPDALYCLGDLIGYNVWPNEVIDQIRRRRIPTIAGNHDRKIKQGRFNEDGKNYAYRIVTESSRDYLNSLPAHIRLEFQLNRHMLTVLLVHGSPRSIDEYLYEDLPEDDVLALLNQSEADILLCGHSHLPYHRILQVRAGDKTSRKHIINTGSVGKPKDGDSRGGYVMLTLHEGDQDEAIMVEFIRFDYDVEQAAGAIANSPLPDEFADRLRNAY